MPDRENVIEGVQKIIKDDGMWKYHYCVASLLSDAAELLKEQKAVSVDVCGQMFTVKYGHCPKCNEGLNSEVYPHWCGFCGQAVKWE